MSGPKKAAKTGTGRARAGRRRLPAGVREGRIVEAAAEAFAELGFGASTRTLARRMKVSQALLYRYFPSKDALIERVFRDRFLNRWAPDWDQALRDRRRPLVDRLTAFYVGFFDRMTPINLRLFLRANLDGMEFARRYAPPLTARYLAPVVAELRHAAGLPDLSATPLLRGERELALVLHGSIVFLGIRRHVYGMAFPGTDEETVGGQVAIFVAGAPAALAELHERRGETPLTEVYTGPDT